MMKILLATDGSSYAREAARFLNHLLHHRAPAHIDVVAIRAVPGTGDATVERRARGFPRAASRDAEPQTPETWLHEARRELTNPELTLESIELTGDPSRLLNDRLAAVRYDLVVAGAKGCGATPFFELGSVARALLQSAPTATLLVRKGGGGYAREMNGARSGHHPTRALIAAAESGSPPDRPDQAEWPLLTSFTLDAAETPVVPLDPGQGFQPREVDRQARRNEVDLLVIDGRTPSGGSPGISASAARTSVWTAPCSVLLLRDARSRTNRVGPPSTRRTSIRRSAERVQQPSSSRP